MLDLRRVQAVGGFVEDDDFRIVQNGLRDAHTLAVAARQARYRGHDLVLKLGGGDGFLDGVHLLAIRDALKLRRVVEKGRDCHFRIERAVLGQVAHEALRAAPVALDIAAIDGNAARRRLQEAREHLHDCGLARAIMAKQAHDFAVPDCEAHIIDGDKRSIIASEILCGNHRGSSVSIAGESVRDVLREVDRAITAAWGEKKAFRLHLRKKKALARP